MRWQDALGPQQHRMTPVLAFALSFGAVRCDISLLVRCGRGQIHGILVGVDPVESLDEVV